MSSSTTPLPAFEGSEVLVTTDGVYMDGSTAPLVRIFDGFVEGAQPTIAPLVVHLVARKPSSVRLRVDGRVPYHVLTECLRSAELAGVTRNDLIVRNDDGEHLITLDVPRRDRRSLDSEPMLVIDGGVYEWLPPPGDPTYTDLSRLPTRHEGLDDAGLVKLLHEQKAQSPNGEIVLLSAAPDLPIAQLVHALDLTRGDQRAPLYPRPILTTGPR